MRFGYVPPYPAMLCNQDARPIFCDEGDGKRESSKEIASDIKIDKNEVLLHQLYYNTRLVLAEKEIIQTWNTTSFLTTPRHSRESGNPSC